MSLLRRLRHSRRLQASVAGTVIAAVAAGLFIAFLVPRGSHATRISDSSLSGADSSLNRAGRGGSTQAGSSSTSGSEGSAGRAGRAGRNGTAGRPRTGPGSGVGRTGPGGVPLDGPEDGPGASDNTASDVGVTTTRITVGFLRPVPTGTPISDADLYNRPEHAYARDINNHGGIHGRNLAIIDEPFDPLLPSEVARACEDLVSNQVFAAFNEGYFNGSCLLANHIFFSHGGPAPSGQYAGGLEFSVSGSSERVLGNWAEAAGPAVRGHSAGTVEESDPTDLQVIGGAFIPRLQAFTGSITRTQPTCAEPVSIQIAVTQMKTAGVTAVFLMTDPCVGPAFLNEANNQQFFPQYHTSDFRETAQDFWAGNIGRRQGFNGAIGMTSSRTGGVLVGQGERSLDSQCRDRYQSQTGISLASDDTPDAQGNRMYAFAEEICGLLNDFRSGASIDGGTLTRDRLSKAYRSLGTHQFPDNSDITFGPNRFDGGTSQRAVHWVESCDSYNGCYVPRDGPGYGFAPYTL